MSTAQDKLNKDAAEQSQQPIEYPTEQDNEDKKGNGAGSAILLFFILGFIASLIVGWVIFPKVLYSRKKQPINYNHALHIELVDGSCENCHYFRQDGSFSGIPKLADCLECHEEINGVSPEEEKFFTQYVTTGREVPWLIYSKQPPNVFFSHAPHVKMAKLDCVTCHGPIGESTEPKIYEENRLTGYSRDIWGRNIAGIKRNTWDRMKMNDCEECHQRMAYTETVAEIQQPLIRHLKEMVAVVFPNAAQTKKGSSVQTGKGACFRCHK
ncbi:MAG: cytochrome c3 family protein [Deltaproteobacteria bacterium]|nr:cytochrome c3 family protein [Deltaproteobacteria bacterium]